VHVIVGRSKHEGKSRYLYACDLQGKACFANATVPVMVIRRTSGWLLNHFQVIRPFLEDGVPLTRIAAEQQLQLRTLRPWVQRYRADGLAGLVRPMRKDKGQKRVVTAQMQHLIEGLALQKPRRTVATIQREVSRITKEQGWKVPSYSTVERIVQQLDPALVTLAPQGSKVYREEFDVSMFLLQIWRRVAIFSKRLH
jgi:transposase